MMRKLLLCASALLVMQVWAEEYSIKELITKPALNFGDVYSLSKDEIKSAWDCQEQATSTGTKLTKREPGITYKGGYVFDLDISFNSERQTRNVMCYFVFPEDSSVNVKEVAKMMCNELKELGIKMPGISGGSSFCTKNLPSPFFRIIVAYADNTIDFTYIFYENGTNPFK